MMLYPPIQIVDHRDKPIGGADMYKAYEEGLIHRAVFVVVLDDNNRILVQKRSKLVENYPNCWDISAGGHVDENESYIQAAHRELKEELGLAGFDLHEVDYFYHEIKVKNRLLKRFNKIYKVKIPGKIPLSPDPKEITAVAWLSKKDIGTLIKDQPDQVASGLLDSMARL
jgi:isopentenyldiphosphate isomerase